MPEEYDHENELPDEEQTENERVDQEQTDDEPDDGGFASVWDEYQAAKARRELRGLSPLDAIDPDLTCPSGRHHWPDHLGYWPLAGGGQEMICLACEDAAGR